MGVGDEILSGVQGYGKIRMEIGAIFTGVLSVIFLILFVFLMFKKWAPISNQSQPETNKPDCNILTVESEKTACMAVNAANAGNNSLPQKPMTKGTALLLTGITSIFLATISFVQWKFKANKTLDTLSGVQGGINLMKSL
jgi:hypothetical protein